MADLTAAREHKADDAARRFFCRHESDGKNGGQRVFCIEPDFAALDAKHAFERQRGPDTLKWTIFAHFFPAKAVHEHGETARFLVDADVAHAKERVLHSRADDFEIGGVFGHQFQQAAHQAASSSRWRTT